MLFLSRLEDSQILSIMTVNCMGRQKFCLDEDLGIVYKIIVCVCSKLTELGVLIIFFYYLAELADLANLTSAHLNHT